MNAGRTERMAARDLVASYLNIALEVSEASGLEKHDPQIIAALIVAQSNDRESEVLAREIGFAAKQIAVPIEAVQAAIAQANLEQESQNQEVRCYLESMDTVITEFAGRNKP